MLSSGSRTNAAVASASASIALGATTVALATPLAALAAARIENMLPALIVARGAHGPVGNPETVDQIAGGTRMADAGRPWLASGVAAAQIKIPAGIDGEIAEWLQFARGGVDGQPLGDRAQVKRQRTPQQYCVSCSSIWTSRKLMPSSDLGALVTSRVR